MIGLTILSARSSYCSACILCAYVYLFLPSLTLPCFFVSRQRGFSFCAPGSQKKEARHEPLALQEQEHSEGGQGRRVHGEGRCCRVADVRRRRRHEGRRSTPKASRRVLSPSRAAGRGRRGGKKPALTWHPPQSCTRRGCPSTTRPQARAKYGRSMGRRSVTRRGGGVGQPAILIHPPSSLST